MDERVRAWLKKQRDDLINMSRTNRLLYFKHTKVASLEVAQPSPEGVLSRLNRGTAGAYWDFYLPPHESESEPYPRQPRPSELVIADKDAAQIGRALKLLERKTNQEFVDKGLWVLYLGLGMLVWTESDDNGAVASSPLLLVPVTIARNNLREPFRLRRTEDDPVLNPALAVKLDSDFDLSLPTIDEFEETSLDSVFGHVEDLVSGRQGWSVSRRVVLSTFTFHKEAMYRDLLDNEGQLAEDPMIQLLALGPDALSSGSFDFQPVPEYRLDHKVPPEDLVSVRDADASQRTCILAARDGRSFVMDGPPGSGKSQTITNIIAELLYAGKTVLFVSEKAAALDVVYNRLRKAMLDDFALQLHSHDANRKAVASELGRALTRRPRATESFTKLTRSDLVKRREALSSYAQALNEIRQPLGRSLHQVLGSIAELQSVPQAPVPTGFGLSLGPDQLTGLLDSAATLGRSWGPVRRGDDFLWRDLTDPTTSASRRSQVERDLTDAVQVLESLRWLVNVIDEELGLGWSNGPSDGRRLLDLLTLLDDRADIPASWLSVDSLDGVMQRFAALSKAASRRTVVNTELAGLVGDGALELDSNRSAQLDAAVTSLNDAQPPWRPDDEASVDALQEVAGFLSDGMARLSAIEADARRVAAAFGIIAGDITLDRAAELAELGGLVGSPTPPEVRWLNPAVQAALDEATRVLGELLSDFRARQEALRTVFTDDVLALDLLALNARFTDVHRGLRKLRRAYSEDKRALAACTVTGRVDRQVRERLADAAAWKELADRLTTAESWHARTLGEHYYQRGEADFNRISSAIEVAHRAVRLAGEDVSNEEFTRQLAREGSPDPSLPPVAERLGANVKSWLLEAQRLTGSTAEQLRAVRVDRIAGWCAEAAGPLHVVVEAVDHVSRVGGDPVSLAFAAQVLHLAAEAHRLHESVVGRFAEDAALLGDCFRGVETDWTSLHRAITWGNHLRGQLGRPVHRRVAEAILGTALTSGDLRDRLTKWSKAAARITDGFTDQRARTIVAGLDEDFAEAHALLGALADTVGDIGEWAAYVDVKAQLDQAGLEPVVSFCVERLVDPDHVRLIIKRALLEAWADDVLKSDAPRLGAVRAPDRDALVEEFRELDRAQIVNAAARVINACAERRPTSNAGAAAIIQRQAQLQRRHMPIRELLNKAGSVAQLLKPCFMMSPLSVSQYLPPSMRFDVVIFDEASQIRPCDAVNCVYRAPQLIVAGDQKQLPPTSFFATIGVVDDDSYDEEQIDEFESVLDLCKAAGALKSLPLNWHYRSEHESLITYSNYRFYDGTLLTFPGATHEASDVGIKLFKVDGVYRRGGARDNPVEAAKVIERVLYHRRNHPKRTLGVVAFSGAQEDAIERELERQATQYPELAGLRTDDRLQGFFVKNLENVQGDERDIIIFSVGYGPDEHGKFTLSMGPLNRKNGWRRLNVAITRAKRRVEIITSVLPEQFSSGVTSDGVRHLRSYLDFAQRGMPALALDIEESEGDAESPFEEEVLRTISGWGYETVPQVGVAGYRIDIGVRDPARPGTYAVGVECDGAMYHSSKVARDRDRLRQQVLEDLDWRIHRIWGTAWYRDRQGQEVRLRAAIEAALQGRADEPARVTPAVETPAIHHEEVDFDAAPSWTVPYRLAELGPVFTSLEMHVPEARSELRRLTEVVVRQEGPVHEERVLQAIRKAWGKGKAGSRIKDAFGRAVRDLARSGLERDRHGFLKTKFSTVHVVRIPTDDPETRREIRHLPQEELRAAICHIVADAHAITHDELSFRVARLFGWQRRGPDIQAALEDAVEELLSAGKLTQTGEHMESGNSR